MVDEKNKDNGVLYYQSEEFLDKRVCKDNKEYGYLETFITKENCFFKGNYLKGKRIAKCLEN